MKSKKEKTGECVYCGTVGPITVDHVPPRSFFPDPPPQDLITVPSCRKCNAGFSKDDDYVRLVLTVNEMASGNADRDQIMPTVMRFAKRKESKNVLASFYNSLTSGYHLNVQGIYVRGQRFTIDGARLDKFAQRVVKALFFREKGHGLQDGFIVNAIHQARLEGLERQLGEDKDFLYFILSKLIEDSDFKAWGEVFGYSWVQSPNGSERTWWLLDFYGTPYYLCSTCPEVEADVRSQ